MWLAANCDFAFHLCVREWLNRFEDAIPALVPHFHEFSTSGWRFYKFRIAIAVRLLSVAGQEIRPARAHVASHVLSGNSDGIHFFIECLKQLSICNLLHGSLRQFLVIAKERE